jgi:KRAB domain-containing zinc finger protein
VQETNNKLNQNVNSKENYHCHYCPKIFKSKAKLVLHSRNHKFPKKYSCNQCSARFFKHAALRLHSLICSKTNVNNLNCMDVPAPQKQEQIVTDVNNVENEYKCLECGKIFSNYKKIYNHKKVHEGIIYRCVECPSTYKSISSLNYHSKTVHELLKFECHYCQSTFKAKFTLKRHMSMHCPRSNGNNLNCMDVPAPQKQAQVVTDIENVENEYKCLECGKIFLNYQTFYHHQKRHEGIIYRCVECPLTFKSISSLYYHSKAQHDLRKFECHYCQCTFKEKFTLQIHMSMHSKSESNVNNLDVIYVPVPQKQAQVVTDVKNVGKEYKCLECGKIFSNYQKFYKHKKMHEGIIYRCVQCQSTYKSKNGLKYHLRTHQSPKVQVVPSLEKYPCRDCPKIFNSLSDLSAHMLEQCFAEA